MVKSFLKFVAKSRYRDILLKAIQDLRDNNLDHYDIKLMKGTKHQKRIRIGSIRIIFIETQDGNEIIEINNRGDIY